MNIVGRRKIWFTLSTVLVGLAVIAIVSFGFQESAEFKGGTLWNFSIPVNTPALADVQTEFSNTLHVPNASVSFDSTNQSFFVRFDTIDETTHATYLAALKTQAGK